MTEYVITQIVALPSPVLFPIGRGRTLQLILAAVCTDGAKRVTVRPMYFNDNKHEFTLLPGPVSEEEEDDG